MMTSVDEEGVRLHQGCCAEANATEPSRLDSFSDNLRLLTFEIPRAEPLPASNRWAATRLPGRTTVLGTRTRN